MELSDRPPDRPQGGVVRVHFRVDARRAPLNGEYLMSLTLGKGDILRLFRAAFDNLKLGQLVKLLGEAEAPAG